MQTTENKDGEHPPVAVDSRLLVCLEIPQERVKQSLFKSYN